VKINMVEKAELVDRVVVMIDKVKQTVGDKVTVVYLTMLPRFVRECCKSHMTDEDVWLLDSVRKEKDLNRFSDREVRVETWSGGLNIAGCKG
jgi:hypothetical protein